MPELDRIEVSAADLAAALDGFEVGPVADDDTLMRPSVAAERLWRLLSANAAHGEPEPRRPGRDALAAAVADPGSVATSELTAIAAIVEGYADPEVRAMATIAAALSALQASEVTRVMHWLCERHGIEFQP